LVLALIIEELLQGSGVVRLSEREHEENTSFLRAEVVRQHAADLLEANGRALAVT